MSDPYQVAGHDLREFVAGWVSNLEAGGGQSRGLLDDAASFNARDRYSLASAYLMSNIGPRANEPDATPEEVLLYAVLAIYQSDRWPGTTKWDGEAGHVGRAFEYFQQLGEREAARRIRADVIKRSTREPDPELEELMFKSTSPGKRAAHEQLMASIDARDFRAAELLDPDGDFDRELQAWLS